MLNTETTIKNTKTNSKPFLSHESKNAISLSKKHTLNIGDILYTSWGYEQTNIDFYQVTKLIGGSTVEVKEIRKLKTDSEYMSRTCIPLPDQFVNDVVHKRRVKNNYISISDFQIATLADYDILNGEKVYNSYRYSSYY